MGAPLLTPFCNVHCFHCPTSAGFNVGWRLATVPPPRLGKVVVRNKCGFTCPIPELTRIDFSQSANSLIVSLCQSCHSLTLPVSHSLSLPLSQSLSLPVWQALILSLCHPLTLPVSPSLSLPLSPSLSLPVWQALLLSLCQSLTLPVSHSLSLPLSQSLSLPV